MHATLRLKASQAYGYFTDGRIVDDELLTTEYLGESRPLMARNTEPIM